MILLDPFYGVYGFGRSVTRWFNRALLIAEIYAIYRFVKLQLEYGLFGDWFWYVLPLAIPLAMGLVNTAVRWVWNVVMVIIYGTTDASVIAEAHDRRQRIRRYIAQEVKAETGRRLHAPRQEYITWEEVDETDRRGRKRRDDGRIGDTSVPQLAASGRRALKSI